MEMKGVGQETPEKGIKPIDKIFDRLEIVKK